MSEIKRVIISKVDLKKLRKKSKLSLHALEKESGVSFSQISAYENGRMRMSEETWEKIKNVLDKYLK